MTRTGWRRRAAFVLAVAVAPGCGGDNSSTTATSTGALSPSTAPTDSTTTGAGSGSTDPDAGTVRCRVRLHGKGGAGGPVEVDAEGVRNVFPTGNAAGWGGRQWSYDSDAAFEEARAVVAAAVEGCDVVLLGGFSNGAAFAAKLYCRGETLGDRLLGVVVDDPVPDHGADECRPDPDVTVTLYWTGALAAQAVPGWPCADADWTCAGGETVGIETFAANLGAVVRESPHDDHAWYVDAPELSRWG